MGLMINYDKTKCMEIGKPTKGRYLRIKNRDIEKFINLYTWDLLLLITTLHRK